MLFGTLGLTLSDAAVLLRADTGGRGCAGNDLGASGAFSVDSAADGFGDDLHVMTALAFAPSELVLGEYKLGSFLWRHVQAVARAVSRFNDHSLP
jgi:hypothetical protein